MSTVTTVAGPQGRISVPSSFLEWGRVRTARPRKGLKMETQIHKHIVTQTETIQFGYWNDANEEFIAIEKPEDIRKAAQRFGCSEDLVDAITSLAVLVRELVATDLTDIWERLDKLESK